MTAALPVRASARLVILDPAGRVLLFQVEGPISSDPARPDRRVFWMTPGGGVEPGEDFLDTAVRELAEETGIRAPIGPLLAQRRRQVVLGRAGGLVPGMVHEQYFLVRAPVAEIDDSGWLDYERQDIRDHRWWTVAELGATGELVVPKGLHALLLGMAGGRMPAVPLAWTT